MDGSIRDVDSKENFVRDVKDFKALMEREFIDLIKDEYFSKTNTVSKVHSYLIIAYKYAGHEINAMNDHFMKLAAYALGS